MTRIFLKISVASLEVQLLQGYMYICTLYQMYVHVSSVESQKGFNAVQPCFVENEEGRGYHCSKCLFGFSAFLVLNNH